MPTPPLVTAVGVGSYHRGEMEAVGTAPAEPILVQLVGAPRSGTTWLQSLLGAHPTIATPNETDLFSRFLSRLDEGWAWQVRGGTSDWAARRHKGLPSVLTGDEFVDLGRGFVDAALAAVIRMKPEASVVLEKSPSHSLCTDVVRTYAPDARFVHLVRDGRDVAASVVAASRGWGRTWAPTSIGAAARVWVEHVEGARRAATTGCYLEVRYEELMSHGPAVLERVFDFCGVRVGEAECDRLLEQHRFEAMAAAGRVSPSILVGGEMGRHVGDMPEPEGFFRSGKVGSWRDEWSPADRRRFADCARELLLELGYEADDAWVGKRTRFSGVAVRAAAARATARVGRALVRKGEKWADQ